MLEGMGIDAPAGYIYIRADNHQGYKDTIIGMTKNDPKYEFPVWDPQVDHHDSHPGHHSAAQLAEARHVAQRVDRGGQLAEDHLADVK